MKYQLLAPMILLLFSFVSASYGYGNTSTYGYGNIPIPSVNTNWNATGLIINWSKVISSSSNETNWNANYSNFLLSYNYATNGTFRPITNFTFYGKNVGINTINPENSTLVVNGGALIGGTNLVTSHNDSLQVIGDYDSANNVSFIQLLADNKTYWGLSYEYNYPLGAFQIFGDYFNDPTATVPSLIFGTANYKNRQLTLEPNSGFVGINTNTPQNNLNVVGDFNATDIIWSEGRNLTLGYDYATNNTFLPISLWNATNTSYLTIANWNATNTSYASWANVINGTMLSYAQGLNGTLALSSSITNWTNNFSNFTTLYSNQLNNITSNFNRTNYSTLYANSFSFYNSTNFPQNSSLMTYANWNSTNTSYALLSQSNLFSGALNNFTGNLSLFSVNNSYLFGPGVLTIKSIGDQFGNVSIILASHNGLSGVQFGGNFVSGIDLIETNYKTLTSNRTIRLENRTGSTNSYSGTVPEFQIGRVGNPSLIIADSEVMTRFSFNVSNSTFATLFFVNSSNGNVTSSNWINSSNGYIVNSSSGFTGTCTIVGLTSITVKGGIITSCS